MQFSQEVDTSTYVIRAYGPGEITLTEPLSAESILEASGDGSEDNAIIRKRTLTRSLVLTPTRLIGDWAPQHADELSEADLTTVAELEPEVVLLGTGESLRWPDATVLAPLQRAGIGYEVMDTAAACRTYNILMFEGRKVAAALMMI